MQDLAQKEVLGSCPGWRPWLGYGSNEAGCEHKSRLLTRTATNAYFPQTLSALSIPDPAEKLRADVESVWDFVKIAKDAATLAVCMQFPQVATALGDYDEGSIIAEVNRRILGTPVPVPRMRETEWNALMAAPLEQPGDYPKPGQKWFARRLDLELPDFLERVVLVHHLREVRAQVGFTRLEGVSGDAEGEYRLDVRTAPLALDADWIPAVEILGEGVFLACNLDVVGAWEGRPAVQARAATFRQALMLANEGRINPITFAGERLLMLHSLAHMLITAISLECGYPATSIRERIYCSSDPQTPRAGILLYTGTPGSEGTLGGLVEIGRNILHFLRRAAEAGRLCSNDPVCAQHDPSNPHEGRFREGAACHGCLLIGEPSCERMNQDLDRAFVVPTVDNADAAFLADWMATWT